MSQWLIAYLVVFYVVMIYITYVELMRESFFLEEWKTYVTALFWPIWLIGMLLLLGSWYLGIKLRIGWNNLRIWWLNRRSASQQ